MTYETFTEFRVTRNMGAKRLYGLMRMGLSEFSVRVGNCRMIHVEAAEAWNRESTRLRWQPVEYERKDLGVLNADLSGDAPPLPASRPALQHLTESDLDRIHQINTEEKVAEWERVANFALCPEMIAERIRAAATWRDPTRPLAHLGDEEEYIRDVVMAGVAA